MWCMGGVLSVEPSFLMSTISWRGEHYDDDDDDNGDNCEQDDDVDDSDDNPAKELVIITRIYI